MRDRRSAPNCQGAARRIANGGMSEGGDLDLDEAEARRIMAGGLGRAELEFATSVCAPLYWIIRELRAAGAPATVRRSS